MKKNVEGIVRNDKENVVTVEEDENETVKRKEKIWMLKIILRKHSVIPKKACFGDRFGKIKTVF